MVFAGQSVHDKGFIHKNETQMQAATAESFFKAAVRKTHKSNMHRGNCILHGKQQGCMLNIVSGFKLVKCDTL